MKLDRLFARSASQDTLHRLQAQDHALLVQRVSSQRHQRVQRVLLVALDHSPMKALPLNVRNAVLVNTSNCLVRLNVSIVLKVPSRLRQVN